MNYNIKQVIVMGWPILSILLLCSIVSLGIFLQCMAVLSRSRRMLRYAGVDKNAIQEDIDVVEHRLAILGTIANMTPFVGLLGTVIGIIRAFHSISANAGGGVTTVAGGIAEALVSTAAGLAVAIPASALYNYFTFRNQKLAKDAGLE